MVPGTHTLSGTDTADTREGFHARLPQTPLGKWSMWLAVAFIVMFVINGAFIGTFGRSNDAVLNEFSRTYMPYYGIGMLLVGLSAGVVGLVGIVRQRERSVITLLTLLPALFVVFFLLGEFLFPH